MKIHNTLFGEQAEVIECCDDCDSVIQDDNDSYSSGDMYCIKSREKKIEDSSIIPQWCPKRRSSIHTS